MGYVPKPGDIGLSYSNTLMGRCVRVMQGLIGDWAIYSHSFIVLHDDYIIESLPNGATIGKLDKYEGTEVMYSRFNLTDDQRDSICEEAIRLEDTPYSWLDFLAIGLNHFYEGGWMSRRVNKRVVNSGKMICSQLVGEAYKRAGIDLEPGTNPQYFTPGDLSRIIMLNFGKSYPETS